MPASEYPSPDGLLVLTISPIPMRMSHEVDSPMLIDKNTQAVVFDPGDLWAAGLVEWSEDSKTLNMGMRLYPDGHIYFELVLELAKDHVTLTYEGKVVISGTLAEVQKKMRSTYETRELTQ